MGLSDETVPCSMLEHGIQPFERHPGGTKQNLILVRHMRQYDPQQASHVTVAFRFGLV